MQNEPTILRRDCEATLIPSGMKATLAQGTSLAITHRLGGNFTVTGPFGMARILGSDADALGLEPEGAADPAGAQKSSEECGAAGVEAPADANGADSESSTPPSREKFDAPLESELWDVAKTVYDPEIPLNIVELGLVYRLEAIETPEGKCRVEADMTLTAPGCAMGPVIADDLKMRLLALPGVDDAEVNIVWDPPWNQDMITEEGKMTLGLI